MHLRLARISLETPAIRISEIVVQYLADRTIFEQSACQDHETKRSRSRETKGAFRCCRQVHLASGASSSATPKVTVSTEISRWVSLFASLRPAPKYVYPYYRRLRLVSAILEIGGCQYLKSIERLATRRRIVIRLAQFLLNFTGVNILLGYSRIHSFFLCDRSESRSFFSFWIRCTIISAATLIS